jgi:hypothetical protein
MVIKTKIVFFFLLAISLFADDTGKNTRNYVVKNFTTAIANPMTSDTNFTTMDGKKSFKGNLSCGESTQSFLDVSYIGTSDINATVKFDKNLDGIKESTFSFNGISGVGANGIVICNANSWNNCKYYSFSYDGNTLSLIEKNRLNVGGLYCINSSCGNLSTTNKTDILNSLGGAISSVLSSYHNNYSITKTSNTGNKIEYYGQSLNDCESNNKNSLVPFSETNGDQVLKQKVNSNMSDSIVYNNLTSTSQNYTKTNQYKNTFSDYKTTNQELNNTLTLNSDLTFSYSTSKGTGTGKLVGTDLKSANFCQVTREVKGSDVYSDGTNKTVTSSTKTYEDEILECTGDNYNICPVVAGETIKYDCGKINNFAEVTSALSAVQEATNDFSCSTN